MENKFISKLEKIMLPLSAVISSNRYLLAMRDAFSIIISFIIVGSFFGIINWVILDPHGSVMGTTGLNLGKIITGLTGDSYDKSGFVATLGNLQYMMNLVVNASFGIFALLLTITFGYRLATIWKADKLISALLSVVALIIITPSSFQQVIDAVSNKSVTVNGAIKLGYFGTTGVITAIIVTSLVVLLFAKLSNNEKLVIRMPDGVPEAVTRSFQALIPITITLFAVALIASSLHWMNQPCFNDLIYVAIQTPLMGFSQGLGFAILYQFLVWIFWWFGIHGHNVTAVIQNSVYLPAQISNQNGLTQLIFTDGFFAAGLMHIMSLALAILVFSKRADWRAVVKVGLPSMCFNIQEPLAFGIPIVLNPILLVPYLISPIVNLLIGWAVISLNIVPVFKFVVPWTMPLFFNGALATGSLAGGLLQLVWLAIDFAIYAPFVIAANNLKQEVEI